MMTTDRSRKLLAAPGVAGPVLFTVAFAAQGFWHPGYSHLADPVSALATGPHAWVQDATFVVFGVLMTAFAVGLHLGVRRARFGAIGPAFLVLSGIGLVLAAVFPARDASGAFRNQPGHVMAAALVFLGAGIGLAVLSRRLARDPKLRGLAGFTLGCGLVTIVLFLAVGALAIPPEAPLHAWLGLGQRLTLAAWMPCVVVLGLRLPRGSDAALTGQNASARAMTTTTGGRR